MATCAELLLQRLEEYGVDTLFGLPGPHTPGLHRGLSASPVRLVSPRLDQGAVAMADGYARVSGRPGVCVVSGTDGLLRATAALAAADGADRPLLVLSSSPRRPEERADPYHATVCRLISDTGVSSETVSDPVAFCEALGRAFAVLSGHRPRAVHLEVPGELWDDPADPDVEPPTLVSRCAPDPATVEAITERLLVARRPFGVLGGGALAAGPDFLALCERIEAPFALSPAAKGVVPEDHPLCVGIAWVPGELRPQLARADVVLAAGASSGCEIWIRDVDGELLWIGQDSPPRAGARSTVHLVGDADLAIACLSTRVARCERLPRLRVSGRSRAAIARESAIPGDAAAARRERVVQAIRSVLPDDGIVVADDSELGRTATRHFPVRQPRSWLRSGGGGSRHALPAAIGARLAEPGREVVCITGDCGLLGSLAELATAAELRIPLAVLVWSNDGRRGVKDQLEREGVPAVGVEAFTPFLRTVAAGFACHGVRVESLGHLCKTLGESFDRDTPSVIEIREDEAFLDG